MPPKTKRADQNVCFDENNFDSDDEYQYEWIRQSDTDSASPTNTHHTKATNSINSDAAKNDTTERRVETSQPATISSATSHTIMHADASQKRKKGKYCIKIDSVNLISPPNLAKLKFGSN